MRALRVEEKGACLANLATMSRGSAMKSFSFSGILPAIPSEKTRSRKDIEQLVVCIYSIEEKKLMKRNGGRTRDGDEILRGDIKRVRHERK